MSPHFQPKPPLAQLEAIASSPQTEQSPKDFQTKVAVMHFFQLGDAKCVCALDAC